MTSVQSKLLTSKHQK